MMMAEPKGQSDVDELESYITDRRNLRLYFDLTDGWAAGLFEPLEFFRLYNDLMGSLLTGKAKPLSHINRIRGLPLTDEQRFFLLYWLSVYIAEVAAVAGSPKGHEKDAQYDVCYHLLFKEFEEVRDRLYPEGKRPCIESEFWFSFGHTARYAETLPSTKDKIEFFTEVMTGFEQLNFSGRLADGGLVKMCQLEIRKLEKLMAMEASGESSDESHSETQNLARNREFTMARQTLAMNFLLQYTKAECPNTDKAVFIAFLTGKSQEKIRQMLSNLYQTKGDNYTKWEKDMKYVRNHFEALGLSEIVKMIDNELNSES